MISVLPCRDKSKIAELFNKHGLQTDDFSGCVIASTNDEALGYCLYRLDDKKITVFAVEPQGDIPLADGILRSALHVAAERFVLDAYYADCAPIDLFEKIDFIKDREEKRLNIDKLFGGCSCHNKQRNTE